MRATTVAKAKKSPGQCGHCRTTIEAGQGYVWAAAFRSAKKVRCLKPECRFKGSDLEPNEKMATIRRAEEDASDSLSKWGGEDAEEVRGILESFHAGVEEAKEAFEESAQNIEDGFGHETEASTEQADKASELDSWLTDIEQAKDDIEDFEFDAAEAESGQDKDEQLEAWSEAVRDKAQEVIDACPL